MGVGRTLYDDPALLLSVADAGLGKIKSAACDVPPIPPAVQCKQPKVLELSKGFTFRMEDEILDTDPQLEFIIQNGGIAIYAIVLDCHAPLIPGLNDIICGIWTECIRLHGQESFRLLIFPSCKSLAEGARYKDVTESFVDTLRRQSTGVLLTAINTSEELLDVITDSYDITMTCSSLGIMHLISISDRIRSNRYKCFADCDSLQSITIIPIEYTITTRAPVGFDTLTKNLSELIGNIMSDVATAQNTYHFIAYTGAYDSLSVTIECMLQTRPNLCITVDPALILRNDKREAFKICLATAVNQCCDLIIERGIYHNKFFGVILMGDVLDALYSLLEQDERRSSGTICGDGSDVDSETYQAIWETRRLMHMASSLTIRRVEKENEGWTCLSDCGSDANVAETLLGSLGNVDDLIATARFSLQVEAGRKKEVYSELARLLVFFTELETKRREANNKAPSVRPFKFKSHVFIDSALMTIPTNYDSCYATTLGSVAVLCGFVRDRIWGGSKLDFEVPIRENIASVIPIGENSAHWFSGGLHLRDFTQPRMHMSRFDECIKCYHVALRHWRVKDFYRIVGPIQHFGPTANQCPMITNRMEGEYMFPTTGGVVAKSNFPIVLSQISPLQRERLGYRCHLNSLLSLPKIRTVRSPGPSLVRDLGRMQQQFPLMTARTGTQRYLVEPNESVRSLYHQLIGVILNGPPSSGVSNVLYGLHERSLVHSNMVLGFRSLEDLVRQNHILLDRENLNKYVNQAGFEFIGNTPHNREVLRTTDGLSRICESCRELDLDGLVLIGGMSSITDSVNLAECFLAKKCKTCVVCVPANPGHNVAGDLVETTIGFDSRCHSMASRIGDLVKYFQCTSNDRTRKWAVVRVGGRYPCRATVEIALQSHPDCIAIPDLYCDRMPTDSKQSILDVVISDLEKVVRSSPKNFGLILVSGNLISRLTPLKLLEELHHESDEQIPYEDLCSNASYEAELQKWPPKVVEKLKDILVKSTYKEFPIEDIICEWLNEKLNATIAHPIQYPSENGRSCIPTNFDVALATAHGYLSSILIENDLTGVMTNVANLTGPPSKWLPQALPLAAFISFTPSVNDILTYGKNVPMAPTPTIALSSPVIQAYKKFVPRWRQTDCYSSPGPHQFWGGWIECGRPLSLLIQEEARSRLIEKIRRLAREISDATYDQPQSKLCTVAEQLQNLALQTKTSVAEDTIIESQLQTISD